MSYPPSLPCSHDEFAGAGKSTMIKMFCGETKPSKGLVWRHSNMRVAYVAQVHERVRMRMRQRVRACACACACACVSARAHKHTNART